MTREEAIEILQGAIKKPNTKDGYLGQSIDMAIKALKAMNQIYKITGGYAEALYQSETAFDGVACVLANYFESEEVENDKDRV